MIKKKGGMVNTTNPPRWDLSNVYPGLDSDQFKMDNLGLSKQTDEIETFFSTQIRPATPVNDLIQLNHLVCGAVDRLNQAFCLSLTLNAYIQSFVTTDSYNTQALRLLSTYEQTRVRLDKQWINFQRWIGSLAPVLPALLAQPGIAHDHAYFLTKTARQSQYLMSQAEEELAAELNLSGANAWNKLQGNFTSQLNVDFELYGELKKMPMPELINLHGHPDEPVRHRAYLAEMDVWEKTREPLAAALNGIKGTVNTLNLHRGRPDALHSALDEAHIDRETLDAMLAAMQASLPAFRRYFKSKAARNGKTTLDWWDLFAPSGRTDRVYRFDEARGIILENFNRFSPDLSSFARYAFDHAWIDAEQRPGKQGGAFCMDVPGVGESRILCNFDGSLDQVSTIAHELGHGYHNHCMVKAGKTEAQKFIPMTLAETASIMCETILSEAALGETTDPQERLAILETQLIGDSQVIVDIYSRYLFETEVFERRRQAELSADEFCEIMERAQKTAYGDGLNPAHLHKYMWTWKSHYYNADLSFYNFPYAFGLLFATGLYSIYQQRRASFIPDYIDLLATTGEAPPVDLAARFGIDIHKQSFWEDSLAIIGRRIDRYCAI
jgi:pepF/M3 family oligoendopeptidase